MVARGGVYVRQLLRLVPVEIIGAPGFFVDRIVAHHRSLCFLFLSSCRAQPESDVRARRATGSEKRAEMERLEALGEPSSSSNQAPQSSDKQRSKRARSPAGLADIDADVEREPTQASNPEPDEVSSILGRT